MKKVLTDRALKAAKPAAPGKRYMLWDGLVPNFGARVTDKGHVSFVVMRRLDGRLVRRAIGDYGELTLERARDLARDAIDNIVRGVDPKELAEIERREREQRRRDSFEAVAEAFIARHVSTLRTRKEVEAAIRRHLIARWKGRAVTSITRRDVTGCLREVIDESGPYAAHKLLAYASKAFNWAIGRDLYGLEHSPCDRIKPTDLIGRRVVRQRVLTNDEIRLFWRATAATAYPFAPLFRLLLLTGQRLHEAADLSWSEIDLPKRLWTIPATRMKADAPHLVPLSTEAAVLLESLPRFAGEFAFTTTAGARPVSGFSKAKKRLDAAMLRLAREEAEERGSDPEKVKLDPWRLHDLRRTARTHFSAIPCQDLVRELAIAHTRPGLHKVYDQFAYLDEKRALFDAWGKRLLAIVDPTETENVVALRSTAVQ
jgi:integrase